MPDIHTGNMRWQPNYSIVVEGEDITDIVRENLSSLTLTDNGGSEKKSDQLSITVVAPEMKLPGKGVKITLSLGFGDERVNKGTFVVDVLASAGSSAKPRTLTITANAFSKTNERGHSTLQSQKTRSFSGITLGELVSTITAEHGLTPKVDKSLVNIVLSHIDQLAESDMNLMTRVALLYGAISKITHDYWVLTPRGTETTASGLPLPTVTITPEMCSQWSYNENVNMPDCSSAGSGTITVPYRDTADGGKTKHITVGAGEPVLQHAVCQPSLKDAKNVASGAATNAKKKRRTAIVDLPATSELLALTAEGKVTLKGFGSVEDGEWKICKLEFKLGTEGFTVHIELE